MMAPFMPTTTREALTRLGAIPTPSAATP